jgi:hypothetical protein
LHGALAGVSRLVALKFGCEISFFIKLNAMPAAAAANRNKCAAPGVQLCRLPVV